MEHSFNIAVAEYCGIEEAIILNNLNHWIQKNQANGTHFYDGKFWTYNSYPAFTKLFPYMAKHPKDENGNPDTTRPRDCQKIKRTIQNLYKAGLIHIGNYNKKGYDRTNWYSLTDLAESLLNGKYDQNCSIQGQNCQSKTTDGGVKSDSWSVENDRPIPYSKQQIENTNKIKLHSPLGFSDENQGGDIDSSFQDNGIELCKPQPKKEPWERHKITKAEYESLLTYNKGLCETINLHAKVEFTTKPDSLVKTFKKIKKDMGLLRCLYSYFRTYRDFNNQYNLVILSMDSFHNKVDRLIEEMVRNTKKYIAENQTIVFHINHEKKFIIYINDLKMKSKDKSTIEQSKEAGYTQVELNPKYFNADLKELGYFYHKGPIM